MEGQRERRGGRSCGQVASGRDYGDCLSKRCPPASTCPYRRYCSADAAPSCDPAVPAGVGRGPVGARTAALVVVAVVAVVVVLEVVHICSTVMVRKRGKEGREVVT